MSKNSHHKKKTATGISFCIIWYDQLGIKAIFSFFSKFPPEKKKFFEFF